MMFVQFDMNNMRCTAMPSNIKKKVAVVEEISGIQKQILKPVCFISRGSDGLIRIFFMRPIHYLCSIP
jgi:hypothetical protein